MSEREQCCPQGAVGGGSALKHFKCYLYGQKITVRTDNSVVSWLHRSKDPVGQPARWIEVIHTYDITFQHRPGRKHGNADTLSRYPCRQCGGNCETQVKAVQAVTRSQRCKPGWTPEEMAARQDADPDIGPIMKWKQAGNACPTLSPRQGTNTASWWDATFRNGSSVSPSRTRRPRRSLESWYTRLWPGTELSESCIVTRARISGRK